ncbi:MAG TPA: mycofactocin biosynthesis glycosyltransferase MftF [Microbacteriaceae bacterium]|nr:mycofactocin biosynthesis glycosyltransferase MftF [Microbacteriaceae bacterium]HRA09872.1 mycofactocin biosynthesis glycosyltransferase MftF [Microbacteriaceae bacterium]
MNAKAANAKAATAKATASAPPALPAPPSADERGTAFIKDMPLAWTTGVAFRDGKITMGGSPWSVTTLPRRIRPFAQKLFVAGRTGLKARGKTEVDAAIYLLDRGIADPLPISRGPVDDVDVVIPVYRHAASLERCLAALAAEGLPVVVVDDASPAADAARIAKAAAAHGARLIVRPKNGGPGEARTDGFNASSAPFVAFVDADVVASADWISRLRPLLDDPLTAAVAPRVLADVRGTSAVELYEETRSELDMGAVPSRVVYGVSVGWLPTASVIMRRAATSDPPFEPGLRVGEDVDLVWRTDEAGWTVRYAPDVVNHHEVRTSLRDFAARRVMYGGSASELERRHPRRLIPARPSLSGIGVLVSLSFRKPWIAAAIAGYEFLRVRRMLGAEASVSVAVEQTALSLWTDAFWVGHLLRRDWWPVGLGVLLATPKSRLARGVAAAMAWEPVRDHLIRPTRLGPVQSLALRALDDASYGTGVIRGALKTRVWNVILPRVQVPTWPKKRQELQERQEPQERSTQENETA